MSVESIQAKSAIVEEIKEKLSRAQSAVVIDYMGINVVEADAMRKQLREAGVDYKVYKNTLVKRAIEGTQFEGLAEVLEGPSAFAFVTKTLLLLQESLTVLLRRSIRWNSRQAL